MITEAFQRKGIRGAFKANKHEDIELIDPEKLAEPPDPIDLKKI